MNQQNKDLYYMVVNGLRSLRTRTVEASNFKLTSVAGFSQSHMVSEFAIIMSVGILFSLCSLGVIVY